MVLAGLDWFMRGPETMERAVLVYTTWPSIVEAERAGRAIVERRLAACVNILPGMISHYWWQGKIERAEEVVMIVKTRAGLADAVGKAVKAAHRYTTPSIMVLPVEQRRPGLSPRGSSRETKRRLSSDRDTRRIRGASEAADPMSRPRRCRISIAVRPSAFGVDAQARAVGTPELCALSSSPCRR